ncbi:restriction endonuclease [Algoriphagus sp. AGSA1]|uniref:restriction endonuclease n=1 Tax=Algoriphagus sp. AGSA1 TaxID=2907213 RepID=UPI001F410A35|nr:restriction endonuclease [Algoriphagus sp. AGSA1]MCE7057974.1 restriction endonuclease [Algoriphagus sp. AGSA1]
MARKKKQDNLPSYDQFMIPLLQGLKELGGSGTIEELNEKVYALLNLTDDVLEIPHSENDSRSETEYRLAWTRTYLKKAGILENSSRGIWTLSDNDLDPNEINPDEIVKLVRENTRKAISKERKPINPKLRNEEVEDEIEDLMDWKEELMYALLKIEPSAFERLCQRLLRESGFVQVEVTGKSGDGGIDGKGIVRINGFLSFHVFFQSKRYKGSVGSGDIRDFRGAMQGRADKGLFITTGNFTREAIKEATRDGAPPIDLIDGDQLCDKLKEFNLGVKTTLIEEVSIETDWFEKV